MPSTSSSEPDVSGFGNSKGHFMIGSGLWPGWRARRDLNPNLLIRSHPHGRSDPFRLVRDLGLVPPVVHPDPEHVKVVQPCGSQPYAPAGTLAVFKTSWAHSEGS